MSGSPPPEPPIEPPQIAGRRRKRSYTPPVTTASASASASAVTSPVTPLEHTAPRLGAQSRVGATIAEFPVQPGPYALAYAPQASYQSSSSLPTASISGPDPRYALASISPRSARKPKAHVASACINCKKKHLRCDNNRPCRRCIASGKEETCVDVEHKKRGRPPLKPEDPSARRAFESTMSPVAGSLGDPMRRMPGSGLASFPAGGGPRSFRPLQAYDPSRPPLRGPPFQSMYAQPSISPSPAIALGTFIPPSRPYPSGPTPVPGPSRPPFSPQQSESSLRSVASYSTGYNYPPPPRQMGPPSHVTYSNPIFPRQPGSAPIPGGSLPPMQGPASLQLPPIRPAPPAAIDPAITQQQQPRQPVQPSPRQELERRGDGTQEPDPKRPKMDIQGILGPRHD
ncbi:hypothetical protein A1O1_02725 [Capronia coronata CBS 617.96]|uniref:Zn(2)-C6 fungal-type domain-containing protein n=1 Tax=Capronia coronata CBS 617.96 TaxID=1182541 RepID=W9YYI4_9EURO|nr:uncharacterized protein A1O1_02725 [Capronia coronata CBS 617.96]EXJ94331.1 hypothetical protein A1O1_02725 [Capronia coronata CBS 617.96]